MNEPTTGRLGAILTRLATGEQLQLTKDSTAGRLDECEIPLTLGHASRTHARITFSEGAAWVEDLGSSNGTFVNGQRISERRRLKSGDRLRFDIEEFDVSLRPAAASGQKAHVGLTRVDPPEVIAERIRAVSGGSTGGDARAAPAPRPIPEAKPKPQAPPTPSGSGARPAAVRSPAPPVADPSPGIGRDEPDGGAQKRPGAWADTLALQQRDGKRTQYVPPADLKKMLGNVGAPAAATPALDEPHLRIVSGSRGGGSFALLSGRSRAHEWSIGSDGDRDLVLADDGVSGFHARLVRDGRRWKLIDHMSANGTFVNGKRSSVSYLASGDRLGFGPVECAFHLPGAGSRSGAARTLRWIAWTIVVAGALALIFFAYQKLT